MGIKQIATKMILAASTGLILTGTAAGQAASVVPQVDHHQHLLSPALAKAWSLSEPVTADRLIAQLDAAGIRRAVVLSLAYVHGSPEIRGNDEYAHVMAENDWTRRQAERYPDRLRAFCSINPLREYALAEVDRCARDPNLRHGLKLHFQIAHLGGSGPRLDPGSKEAMLQLAEAVSAPDPRTRNLYFDITTNVIHQSSAENAAFITARIRQIGLQRILYGSDLAIRGNATAQESWRAHRAKLALTEGEFRIIADNVAPYMR